MKRLFKIGIRRAIQGLPLAAVVIASFLPLKPGARHILVAATLIWLQIILLFEVFFPG